MNEVTIVKQTSHIVLHCSFSLVIVLVSGGVTFHTPGIDLDLFLQHMDKRVRPDIDGKVSIYLLSIHYLLCDSL